MEHDVAIKNNAAERYLLGELNEREMEEYEEHFFSCSICAEEVKIGSEFIDHAREVFKTDFLPDPDPAPVAKSTIWGRFWSSLRVPAPAFACALLALVGFSIYQSSVINDLKKPEVLAAASMTLRNARGPNDAQLQVAPNQSFSLKFDITSEERFSAYEVQLLDQSGRKLLSRNVPAEQANDHLQMAFRGGTLKPGEYKVVIRGINKENANRPEIANYSFALAFQN
ncbi:MAG TPA: hypothetical protein VG759_14490 [Candidatus Angelobacter sp.]|nr:hypothetical protein [Candidatus Angelobacter sp.]